MKATKSPGLSTEAEDVRLHCCFGPFRTHVVSGARKVALAGFVLNWMAALVFFLSQCNAFLGLVSIFEALTCLSIVVAARVSRRHRHLFYLPFLVLYVFWLLLVVLITVYQTATSYKWIPKAHFIERRLALIGYSTPSGTGGMGWYLVATILGLAFVSWICSVIFRAYRFLQEEDKGNAVRSEVVVQESKI